LLVRGRQTLDQLDDVKRGCAHGRNLADVIIQCQEATGCPAAAQFPISRKNWLVGVRGTVALLSAPLVVRG
jgi:hypothetical protein